ncbi:MAG: hypothetical protein ACHQO8_04005 [Vicinamibacterales bacterium]
MIYWLANSTSDRPVSGRRMWTRGVSALALASLTLTCENPGARRAAADDGRRPTPTYNQQNGKLTELDFDRDGDGKIDTRAFMDGVLVKSIEIDRDGSGKADRWEYYEPASGQTAPANSPDGRSVITRAEEANGKAGKITRREYYENGIIARVEEDTDGNGRVDKWETYDHGVLSVVELDLDGRGKPGRRFVYRPDGTLDRLEVDTDGHGNFKVKTTPGADEPRDSRRSVSPARKGGG